MEQKQQPTFNPCLSHNDVLSYAKACAHNVKDTSPRSTLRLIFQICLPADAVALSLSQDYNNLCQCESLEDVKLNLQETDYDQFLSQENKVTPAALQDRATKKLVSHRWPCARVLLLWCSCTFFLSLRWCIWLCALSSSATELLPTFFDVVAFCE